MEIPLIIEDAISPLPAKSFPGYTHHMEHILGIHINLPKELHSRIVKNKRALGIEYSSNYESTPHVTLYLSRFPKKNFAHLTHALCRTTRSLVPFRMTVKEPAWETTSEGNPFVALACARTKPLMMLHRTVLRTANTLRERLIRSKDEERIRNGQLVGEKKRLTLRYGYARVLRQYHPHITYGEILEKTTRLPALKRRVHTKTKELIGTQWKVDRFVVGLSLYDVRKQRYVRTIKKTTIELSLPG